MDRTGHLPYITVPMFWAVILGLDISVVMAVVIATATALDVNTFDVSVTVRPKTFSELRPAAQNIEFESC